MRLLYRRPTKIFNQFYTKYHLFRNRILYRGASPNPDNITFLDPKDIEYLMVSRFQHDYSRSGSYVFSGDWDRTYHDGELNYLGTIEYDSPPRSIFPIEDYGLYHSFKLHFKDDVDWIDTPFYQWLHDNLDHNIPRYESPSDIESRLEYLDELFEDMKENGYMSQTSLGNHCYDELLVNIGRNGTFILDDGRHRFCMARLIGITSIPVRIFVRHEKWQQIRVSAHQRDDSSPLPDSIVHRHAHPDLENLISGNN